MSSPFRDSKQVVEYAYHGTYQDVADCVCTKGEGFKVVSSRDPLVNSDHWFGEGAYFYDGDLEAAKFWPKRAKDGEKVAVIEARVRLGVMLDVQTTEGQAAMDEAYRALKKNPKIPTNEITDASVIDYLAKVFKFDTVRGTGRIRRDKLPEVYGGSSLLKLKALIICVKNLAMIERSSIVWQGLKER